MCKFLLLLLLLQSLAFWPGLSYIPKRVFVNGWTHDHIGEDDSDDGDDHEVRSRPLPTMVFISAVDGFSLTWCYSLSLYVKE